MVTPLEIWLEKKNYLEQQLAIIADPNQKFALRKQLEECEKEIANMQSKSAYNHNAITNQYILGYFISYILDFVKIISSPRVFSKQYSQNTQPNLQKAIVFLLISLIITVIIKLPPILQPSVLLYFLNDGLWKLVVVVIISAIMRTSWFLLNGQATFVRYFTINCYFFGVFCVIIHLLIACIKVSNEHLLLPIYLYQSLYVATMFLVFFVWCPICWTIYYDLNGLTILRSSIAFLFNIAMGIPAIVFSYTLRTALLKNDILEHLDSWYEYWKLF